jgi:hypothetical protein
MSLYRPDEMQRNCNFCDGIRANMSGHNHREWNYKRQSGDNMDITE